MSGLTARDSPSANAIAASQSGDIHDSPAELERWPQLAVALQLCMDQIAPAFDSADQDAIRHQRAHRWLTKLAAVFGTAAVVFAIVHLGYPGLFGRLMKSIEILAALAAFLAVVLGLISSRQSSWLLERHKAERLRLAKFRFLVQPEVWMRDGPIDPQIVQDLQRKIQEIQSLKARDLRDWVEREQEHSPPPPHLGNPGDVAIDQLVDYYLTKRLLLQRDFFRCRAQTHERIDKFTRHLGPALFFLSVLAVFVHLLIELAGKEDTKDGLGNLLIVLAASLPVLGGGIRTLRLAYEFARNTSRYRAKALALDRIVKVLEHEKDPWSILREVWYTEDSLEFEHREWCRLMIEAEWLP